MGGIASPNQLTPKAIHEFDKQIDWYLKAKNQYGEQLLKVGEAYAGQRPGSYIVFVSRNVAKRKGPSGKPWYYSRFFCQNFVSNKYKIVFKQITKDDKYGACFIDVK